MTSNIHSIEQTLLENLLWNRARIKFLTYVWDRSRMGGYSIAGIDKTEREDENIVEQVQKGIASRFYKRGRYSPQWETGVHQFHTLLQNALGEGI